MANILILGTGGFGVALAVLCAENGHEVTAYSPFTAEVEALRRDGEHKKLLPGIPIPKSVVLTDALPARIESDLVIIATPSFAVEEVCRQMKPILSKNTIVACVAKGFAPASLRTMSEVIGEVLPENYAVALSGPSHAEELGRGVPTTVVAASRHRPAAEFVQDTLMCESFRIYVNDDVAGVELGGALKNVIALAAGVCNGMALGDNVLAALMTRGITEIARLGVVMGAQQETFAGLSGMGDLIVTCTSQHSRNQRAGRLVGQGMLPKDAIAQIGMTVEGYAAAKCARDLAKKYQVDMPIIEQMYLVLYENKRPQDAVRDLMKRPKRHESEKIWLSPRGA